MESDWKAFSKMLPELRERYLTKLNARLIKMLENPGQTPTERFWDAHEKMHKESKILRECLDGARRSQMHIMVCSMLYYGMMDSDDLSKFSEEFQQQIKLWRRE
jgi:hypothetical protein